MKAKEFDIKKRDPNWRAMQDIRRSGAGGQHKDKKRAAKQGEVKHKGKDVAEAIDIGREWMSDTELDQYVPDDLQQEWRELVGYDEDGNAHPLWANMTGDYEPDVSDPQHRAWMVKVANKWFAMKKIPNVRFFDVRDLDDELEWLVQIGDQGVAEGTDFFDKFGLPIMPDDDGKFRNMMRGIKRGTKKQARADRRERDAASRERARTAFGPNPADKLSIRSDKGVAEEEDFTYTTEKQILTRIRQIMYDRKLSGTESNAGELYRLKQQLKDMRSQQSVSEGDEPDEQYLDKVISDLHKDAFGMRPDHEFGREWMSSSYEEKLRIFKNMLKNLHSDLDEDYRDRLRQMRQDTQDRLAGMRSNTQITLGRLSGRDKPSSSTTGKKTPQVGDKIEFGQFNKPDSMKTATVVKVGGDGMSLMIKTDDGKEGTINLGNKSLTYRILEAWQEMPFGSVNVVTPAETRQKHKDFVKELIADGVPERTAYDVLDSIRTHVTKGVDWDTAVSYAFHEFNIDDPYRGDREKEYQADRDRVRQQTVKTLQNFYKQVRRRRGQEQAQALARLRDIWNKGTPEEQAEADRMFRDDPEWEKIKSKLVMKPKTTNVDNQQNKVAEASDWGDPREILEDVLRTLEREVEWPLTEVMDPKEVSQLLAPIIKAVNDKMMSMDEAQDDWGSMSHREFKRRELQHELGHEDDPKFQRMMREKDRGPWYIKIDGKIYKQKGEPKVFDWKKGANNYALAILKNRPELKDKIVLTKNPVDQ